MVTITLPKSMTKRDDLIIISRAELERLIERGSKKKEKEMTEDDILKMSKEATRLWKAGKLPVLHSLKVPR